MKKLLLILLILGAILFYFRLDIIYKIQLAYLKSLPEGKSGRIQPYIHAIFELKGKEKFFPHRVNSLKRFKYLYNDFKGFECDVSFNKQDSQIYVGHERMAKGNELLETFFEADTLDKIFWLDIKGLRPEFAPGFAAALDRLHLKFGLKHRVIVESRTIASLEILSKEGFTTTSYYFSSGKTMDSTKLASICSSGKWIPEMISCDIEFTPLVKKVCRQQLFTWDLAFSHSFDKNRLRKLADDESILVCLLNIKSPGYR